jgi:hypothetical protein
MWVFNSRTIWVDGKPSNKVYDVGYFTPDGFNTEFTEDDIVKAADLVHYLNGGARTTWSI